MRRLARRRPGRAGTRDREEADFLAGEAATEAAADRECDTATRLRRDLDQTHREIDDAARAEREASRSAHAEQLAQLQRNANDGVEALHRVACRSQGRRRDVLAPTPNAPVHPGTHTRRTAQTNLTAVASSDYHHSLTWRYSLWSAYAALSEKYLYNGARLTRGTWRCSLPVWRSAFVHLTVAMCSASSTFPWAPKPCALDAG